MAMGNEIVVKAYIQALEGVVDDLKIEQGGVGFVSGKAKHHIRDSSVARLIKTTAEEINYDNGYRSYGSTPRERLYWSFNGHGLDSPEEIRKELTDLIKAAKNTLPASAEK